jgi:hypothetical protein
MVLSYYKRKIPNDRFSKSWSHLTVDLRGYQEYTAQEKVFTLIMRIYFTACCCRAIFSKLSSTSTVNSVFIINCICLL